MQPTWWMGRAGASLALGVPVVLITALIGKHDGNPVNALGFLLLVAPAIILLWRNRFPLTVFLLCAPIVGGYYVSGNPPGPEGVYLVLALFVLALLRGPVLSGLVALGTLIVAFVAMLIGDPHAALDGRIAFGVAWAGMAVAAGSALAARRNTLAARREQAEERTRHKAEEERLRIAREVHDVVAHSLAMINVQAGVGAHVADRRPEEAKAALLAIKEASQSALADLRATLAVLRGIEDRAPAPSLRRLAELTDATTAAGLRVDVDGEPGELPAPVDLAAYRIVQESLTNAVRHAKDASKINLLFVRTNGKFELHIRDNGSGSVDPGSGNGLRGMRERAEALGGTLLAGPAGDGGFAVRAVLPVRDADT